MSSQFSRISVCKTVQVGFVFAIGTETPKRGGFWENWRHRRERVKALETRGSSHEDLIESIHSGC